MQNIDLKSDFLRDLWVVGEIKKREMESEYSRSKYICVYAHIFMKIAQ
jgi:hypothetical protein